MIVLALVFGALAVYVAQYWLDRQADMRLRAIQAETRQPVLTASTVVVAARPLRYGQELAASDLKEVPWPADAVPPGSSTKVKDLLAEGKRAVLAAIEPNEPVLAAKITGPGQRATLSAALRDGMQAIAVRVSDTAGVAGFVLPGDRVDLMLTHQQDKADNVTDVLLQDVRVLAIDQSNDERSDKPLVVKTVTLEVSTLEAQKITLAGVVGTLSLSLRKAGETASAGTRRVTLADLGITTMRTADPATSGDADDRIAALERQLKALAQKDPVTPVAKQDQADRGTIVSVVRAAAQRQEYAVPTERRVN